MNSWNPHRSHLERDERGADVWLVQVSDADRAESLFARLSKAEQERAARFKFAKDRQLFVAAHAGLRSILSNYLQTDLASLEFIEGSNGKPSLARPSTRIEFNLSHSHHRALLAVSLDRQVGVDIEYVKRDFQFDEVAESFFTAREVAALRGLPSHLQRQAFFKCWTSKEAFLKAKGTGLSGKLEEVKISLASDQQVQIAASVAGWSLADLDPGVDYEAALVVEGAAVPIRCYRWESSHQ